MKGSEIDNFEIFVSEKQKQFPDFEPGQIEFLCKMYGTEIDVVIQLAQKHKLTGIIDFDGEMEAQVVYAVSK